MNERYLKAKKVIIDVFGQPDLPVEEVRSCLQGLRNEINLLLEALPKTIIRKPKTWPFPKPDSKKFRRKKT